MKLTKPRTILEVARPSALPDAGALEFFARVARAGGFAAAARELGLTRAAVSRRVAHVEALAGAPLFLRSTRAFGLTEAGRHLLARARAVLDAAEAARRDLRVRGAPGADAPIAGTLRLTSVPLFGQSVLAPLLAEFRARHPALRIEMRFTARRIDLLREDVDLAFRLTERPPEDCVAQPVLPYVVRAYAAPGPGLPLDDPRQLAGRPCLLLSTAATDEVTLQWRADGSAAHGERSGRAEGRVRAGPSDRAESTERERRDRGAGGARDEDLPTVSVTLQPAMLADDLGSLQAVARAGGGIVFAPDFCVAADVASGALVPALPGWRLPLPEGDAVMAITLPWSVAPAAARALVSFMREALAQRSGQPHPAG